MRQFYLYRIGLLNYLLGCLVIPVLVSEGWSQDQIFIDPLYGTDKVVVNDIYRPGARRVGGTTVNLRYDLYRPATLSGGPILPETLPGMVLVHGGGFVQGSKTNSGIVQMAEYFSQRGYVVASINYRLINTGNPLLDPAVEAGPFPVFPPTDPNDYNNWANNPFNYGARIANGANAAHNDTSYFANQFFGDAIELGIDMDRVALAGSSAGAITSLMAGYGDHANGPQNDFGTVISLAGALYGLEYLVDADDPALWFQHGTNDTTVPYSNAERLLGRALDVGLTHTLHTHQSGHSIFEPFFNSRTDAGLTFAEDSTRFLYNQMNLAELASVPEPSCVSVLGALALPAFLLRRRRPLGRPRYQTTGNS
ncbi:MAG: alpha/beta hydrolase [Mariniblastus sp.]|nr:alpha/beta hydrolase [Mariniblastus sp.]